MNRPLTADSKNRVWKIRLLNCHFVSPYRECEKNGGFAMKRPRQGRFSEVKISIGFLVRRSRFASQFPCKISKRLGPDGKDLTKEKAHDFDEKRRCFE